MRCVLLVQGSACLSCDLSRAACLYSDVVDSPAKSDRSLTTSNKSSRASTPQKPVVGASHRQPSYDGAGQHLGSGQSRSRPSTASTATPPQTHPANAGPGIASGSQHHQHSSAPFTLNYTLPAPAHPSGRTSLADLISTVSATLSAARTLESAAVDEAEGSLPLRALDLEANEDEEVYLVSTASERDALMLNMLAPPARDTSMPKDAVPGLKLRHVSPTIAFVYYQTKVSSALQWCGLAGSNEHCAD